MSTSQHSKACCTIPPIVAKDYKTKGSYEEVGGFKSYVTGPNDATKGVVVVYDIFGFFDQTIQGADIVSTSDEHQKYRVFIPDWFEGEPCAPDIIPPDTKEKQERLGAFFKKHSPPSVAGKLPEYVKAAQAKYPSIKSWAVIGYCWGGKVAALASSGSSTPFSAAASIHPAMVDGKDGETIKIPFLLLASKDEPVDDVKKFEANLSGAKHIETFADQAHGWMAARADLENARNKEEYVRGYKTVVEFFGKNWK